MTRLTCRHDDPLLLWGAAGWGGRLGADTGLRVRGLVRHRRPVVAHVSGALGDAAVHRGLAARTEKKKHPVMVLFTRLERCSGAI